MSPFRLTATKLTTAFQCGFLFYVTYRVRQPLPRRGTRRRFGIAIHAAIATYERERRSLELAFDTLDNMSEGLTVDDYEEARQILRWRHHEGGAREGETHHVEYPIHTEIQDVRLVAHLDRLDKVAGELLLVECKSGKAVDLKVVRAQMMIQAYAVWRDLRKVPALWEVELLHQRRTERLEAEQDPQELRNFTARLAAKILEGDFTTEPADPHFCGRCPARSYCPRVKSEPSAFTRSPAPLHLQKVLF